MSPRRITSILIAEFLGTFVLALGIMSMLIRTDFAFFSGVAAALIYGIFILIFGSRILTHLNPAVTIGLWTVRKINTLNAFVYIVVQVIAGFAALKVGEYFLAQPLQKTVSGGFNWRVMVAEGLGALIFTLAISAALNNKKIDLSHKAVLSGLGLVVGMVIASLAGHGILNPAVAISLRSISWAYILGPIVGAILGFNLYELVLEKNFKVMDLLGDETTKTVKPKTVAKKTTKK
jgi:glycerol uptake facilitator-like aquaporin